jgi:hypothetical protein
MRKNPSIDWAIAGREIRKAALAGVVLALVAALATGAVAPSLLKDRQLSQGPRATASVLAVLHLRGQSSTAKNDTTTVRIGFVANSGARIEASLKTKRFRTGSRSLAVGDQLRISYDDRDPTRVRSIDAPEKAWAWPAIVAGTLWGFSLYVSAMALAMWLGWFPRKYFAHVYLDASAGGR